jgi:hypothetical protein
VRFAKAAVDTSDQFNKMAQQTGITTETLSTLGYAADLAGVNVSEMAISLKTLATQMSQASAGGKESQAMFNRLGINVRDASGGLRSMEDVLLEVAEQFQKMPDGAAKSALAVDLFGRSGLQMIPLLNQGAAGLRKMQEEARAMGLELSGKTAQDAEDFNDNLSRLTKTVQGFVLTIVKEALPVLNDFVQAILGVIKSLREAAKEFPQLQVTLNVMLSGVLIAAAGWRILGDTILAVSKAANAAAKLNFYEAGRIMGQLAAQVKAHSTATGEKIGHLFNPQKAEETKPTAGNALVDPAEKLKQAQTEYELKRKSISLEIQFKNLEMERLRTTGLILEGSGRTVGSLEDEEKAQRLVLKAVEDLVRKRMAASGAALEAGLITTDQAREEELKDASDLLGIQQTALKLQEDLKKIEEERMKGFADMIAAELKAGKELAEAKDAAVQQAAKDSEARRRRSADNALDRNQSLQRLVGADPDLMRAQRKEALLPLMQRELELINQGIALNQQLAESGVDADAQLTAERELTGLMEKRVELQRSLSQMQDDGFLGSLTRGVRTLAQEWENLGARMADIAVNSIRRSIDAVADGIWAVIDGTQTWGDIFAQVGRQIISDIIRIVLQWVVSQLIIRGLSLIFGKTIAATTAGTAASAAAAWAPAATMASIASYGAAAGVGLAAFTAAVISGTAIGAASGAFGAGASMAFESGGIIPGGRKLIEVNERGTEAVLNARATRRLGSGVINALNAGLMGAQQLEGMLASGLAAGLPPAATTSSSFQSGSAPSPTSGGNQPTVLHLNIAIFDLKSSRAAQDFAESAKGQSINVETNRNHAIELGINV